MSQETPAADQPLEEQPRQALGIDATGRVIAALAGRFRAREWTVAPPAMTGGERARVAQHLPDPGKRPLGISALEIESPTIFHELRWRSSDPPQHLLPGALGVVNRRRGAHDLPRGRAIEQSTPHG